MTENPVTTPLPRSTWPGWPEWIWSAAHSRRPVPPHGGRVRKSARAAGPSRVGAARQVGCPAPVVRGRDRISAIPNRWAARHESWPRPGDGVRGWPRARFSPNGRRWSENRSPSTPQPSALRDGVLSRDRRIHRVGDSAAHGAGPVAGQDRRRGRRRGGHVNEDHRADRAVMAKGPATHLRARSPRHLRLRDSSGPGRRHCTSG